MKILGDLLIRLRLQKGELDKGMNESKTAMSKFTSSVIPKLAALAAAFVSVRAASKAMNDALQEDLAFERMRTMLRNVGLEANESSIEVRKLAEDFQRAAGIAQGDVFISFRKAAEATKSFTSATYLLHIAARLSIATGESMTSQMDRLTGAVVTGGDRLTMLARSFNIAMVGGMDVVGVLKELEKKLDDINPILETQAIQLEVVKAQWADLTKALMRDFAPGIIRALGEIVKGADQVITGFRQLWETSKILGWLMVKDLVPYHEYMAGVADAMGNMTKLSDDWEERTRALNKALGEMPEYDAEKGRKELEELLAAIRASRDGVEELSKAIEEIPDFWPDHQRARFGFGLREDPLDFWTPDDAEKWKEREMRLQEYADELKRQSQMMAATIRDTIGAALSRYLVDTLFDAKRAFEDFGDFVKNLLKQILQMLLQARIQSWITGMFPPGTFAGTPSETAPPVPPGGGAGSQGMRRMPLPQPMPMSRAAPNVTIVVQGDVTRFAEFSERVVQAGVERAHQIGR